MREISPNLLAPPPTVAGIAAALRMAVTRVDDCDGRAGGSAVAWSRDWNESFHDDLIDRVASFLGR